MPSDVTALANTTSAVISRLRAWAAAKGWTKSRFANEAGLRDTTLRGFHKPDWNPTIEVLERLECVVAPGWQEGDPLPETLEHPAAQASTATASADRAVGEVAS